MLLTCSLIQWTTDCEKALDRGDKKGLKSLKKKQVHTRYLCAGSSNWRSSDQSHKSVLMLETDWNQMSSSQIITYITHSHTRF